MADIHDLITPWPALLPAPGLRLNPPCNGGGASKPKPPPPAPAPVRADSAEGEQASIAASRRQGLRKTIDPNSPLAPEPALGSLGKLGVGGLEGTMVNTQKQEGPVAGWGQLTWAQKKALSPNRQ